MNREDLFEWIGEVDEEYLLRAEETPRPNLWKRWAVSVACFVLFSAICVFICFFTEKRSDIPSGTSSAVAEIVGASTSGFDTGAPFGDYSQKCFWSDKKRVIFRGTVTDWEIKKVRYQGDVGYCALVNLRVLEVYKGPLQKGQTVSVCYGPSLLLCPGQTMSILSVGTEGIFAPLPPPDGKIQIYTGRDFDWSGVVDYHIQNPGISSFIYVNGEVKYAGYFHKIEWPVSFLDDVEPFIYEKLEEYSD